MGLKLLTKVTDFGNCCFAKKFPSDRDMTRVEG